MTHTDTARQPLDRHAARIHDLIAGCCVASEPVGDLLEVRADLLALAGMTDDGEAADAACGAVIEIDDALAVRAAAVPQRRAS